jgi:hypothetical protein
MSAKWVGVLAIAAAVAAAAFANQEVISDQAKIAFAPPETDWRVNTDLRAPVAAMLENKPLGAIMTVTYYNYEIYGSKVDYGFLKDKLEKQEKNSFKLSKPNYSRVSLESREFPCGKTARLEFTTYDELGYHHTVVYAVASGTRVVFVAAESLEREWSQTNEALDKLLTSVRVIP